MPPLTGGPTPPPPSSTGSTGCANITYDATCPDNPGGANNTQHNDGCSTIDSNMPDQSHVGTYATRPGSPNIWKILAIGAQNTTNNGHAYTSSGCTGGPTPPPLTGGPTPPPPSAPQMMSGGPTPPGLPTKGKDDVKKEKELNEEFTRMKTMWKYRI